MHDTPCKRQAAERETQHRADEIGLRREDRADAKPAEFAAECRENMAEAVALGRQLVEAL